MLKTVLIVIGVILGIILFALCTAKFYFMYCERSVNKKFETESKLPKKRKRRRKEEYSTFEGSMFSVEKIKYPVDEWAKEYLAGLRSQQPESFYGKLNRIIKAKNMDAIEVYKKADVDRRLFSKFKKEDYHPRKKTVLALALAMELTVEETEDLLLFNGYAFAPNRDFDLIIQDCLKSRNYDLVEVNKLLYRCTGETL